MKAWKQELPEFVNILKYSHKHVTSYRIEKELFGSDFEGKRCRSMVNYLRRRRAPIGSDENGYFWATKPSQLEYTRAHLWSRVKSIIAAVKGLTSPKWDFDVADIESEEIIVESEQIELI